MSSSPASTTELERPGTTPGRQPSAERAGFEPATHLSARTRFPVALLRPLGHLSEERQGIPDLTLRGSDMSDRVDTFSPPHPQPDPWANATRTLRRTTAGRSSIRVRPRRCCSRPGCTRSERSMLVRRSSSSALRSRFSSRTARSGSRSATSIRTPARAARRSQFSMGRWRRGPCSTSSSTGARSSRRRRLEGITFATIWIWRSPQSPSAASPPSPGPLQSGASSRSDPAPSSCNGRTSRTSVAITREGRAALESYTAALRDLLGEI